MKRIFDSSFRYWPSFDTDVRRTFARVRRELRAQMRRNAKLDKVVVLPKSSVRAI